MQVTLDEIQIEFIKDAIEYYTSRYDGKRMIEIQDSILFVLDNEPIKLSGDMIDCNSERV